MSEVSRRLAERAGNERREGKKRQASGKFAEQEKNEPRTRQTKRAREIEAKDAARDARHRADFGLHAAELRIEFPADWGQPQTPLQPSREARSRPTSPARERPVDSALAQTATTWSE